MLLVDSMLCTQIYTFLTQYHLMDIFQAIIIAIIEGLTEYLPVSSTAHMIFTSSFFGIQEDEFVKLFQVSFLKIKNFRGPKAISFYQ